MKQKTVAFGRRVVEVDVRTVRIETFFTEPAEKGVALPAHHFVAALRLLTNRKQIPVTTREEIVSQF
jgi:hypothetical protein